MTEPAIFVTGGTGLVGSHLMYELLRKGRRVKALKRPTSDIAQTLRTFAFYTADAEAMFRRIEWVDVDLFDFEELVEAMNGCDAAYHAAAVVSFCDSDKTRMMKTNVEGTANVVNACMEKQIPLCFVSSIAALGRSESDNPIAETDLWQTSEGRSAYACSKHKAEMEVWRGIAEGLRAAIVNPSVILGPGNWTKGSAKFFTQVHKGMRFHTPGTTGFVDVRDVVRCMMLLMEQEHFDERYILSAGDLSYRALFDMIADGLSVKRPSSEARPWMLKAACLFSAGASLLTGKSPLMTKETADSAIRQLHYSNAKIIKTLEYEFIPLKKTIEECCAHFLPSASLAAPK